MRLLFEMIGWVFTAIGAYQIFEDQTSFFYYILLVIGIILLVITLPKSFRKTKGK